LDLYEYSYFLDRYNVLGNPGDLVKARYYESLVLLQLQAYLEVPAHIVTEFEWRRERNFNVSVLMVILQ
jgi:hypothetical protein